jgi:hypothetical protein
MREFTAIIVKDHGSYSAAGFHPPRVALPTYFQVHALLAEQYFFLIYQKYAVHAIGRIISVI